MSEHLVIVYTGDDSVRSVVKDVVVAVGASPLIIQDRSAAAGVFEGKNAAAVVLDAAHASKEILSGLAQQPGKPWVYLLVGVDDEAFIKGLELSHIDGFVPKMMTAPILKELLQRCLADGQPELEEGCGIKEAYASNRRGAERPAAGDGRLTGLIDKLRFLDLLRDEERREFFYENAYSILMVELDQIAKVFDEYGREGVEEVYREVARLMQNNIRVTDTLAEWDEGRFMVLAEARKDARRAKRVAERLRRKVEGSDFRRVTSVVTASFGVTAFDKDKTPEEHIEHLESILAAAAGQGKNKIIVG